jgi:hypothetical protein
MYFRKRNQIMRSVESLLLEDEDPIYVRKENMFNGLLYNDIEYKKLPLINRKITTTVSNTKHFSNLKTFNVTVEM